MGLSWLLIGPQDQTTCAVDWSSGPGQGSTTDIHARWL